jgi:DNA-binding GntR family transcriptional regulator
MSAIKKNSPSGSPSPSGATNIAPHPRAKDASRPLQSLPEQIAERIYAAIASGKYSPGDRIREEVLAEQFEVSRGPVREALRILEKDWVVRIVPNRGAHVTLLSIKEVNDLFELRGDLSRALTRRLGKCNAELMARIESCVQELETLAAGESSGEAYVEVSFRLSGLLRDGCGNERLAEILGSLARQTRRYTQLGLATPTRRKESARHWRTMLRALKTGNVDGAAASIEKLMDDSRREAIKQLEADPANGSSRVERKAPRNRRSQSLLTV